MILNYIGGARNVAIKDLSEQELVEQVHADALKTILKPGRPLPNVKVWEKAIPQFNLGHLDVLAEAENALKMDNCGEKDGLFLGGNYTAGVALGRCVEFGIDQADEVLDYPRPAPRSRRPPFKRVKSHKASFAPMFPFARPSSRSSASRSPDSFRRVALAISSLW